MTPQNFRTCARAKAWKSQSDFLNCDPQRSPKRRQLLLSGESGIQKSPRSCTVDSGSRAGALSTPVPGRGETPPSRCRPGDRPIHSHMLRHACGFKLANNGHDTRALQHYLGHKNIQHTVRYTEMAPDRFKTFGGTDDSGCPARVGYFLPCSGSGVTSIISPCLARSSSMARTAPIAASSSSSLMFLRFCECSTLISFGTNIAQTLR
jgi:Phage integrase family